MADDFPSNWWGPLKTTSFETPSVPSFGWTANSSSAAAVLTDPNSEIVGFHHPMDWNHSFVRGGAPSEDSPVTDFQQMNLGYTSDQNQPHFSSQSPTTERSMMSQSLAAFSADPSAAYGFVLPENPMNYAYSQANEFVPSWNNNNNKFSQFPRPSSSSKPPQTAAPATAEGRGHIHFMNSTPFWNAETRPTFFPDIQKQNSPALSSSSSYTEKGKNTSEVSTAKKASPETSAKRPRSDSSSPLPPFKVRKEKMGDRITALQQLVSPFGKTDTASVLSEAIEYIKYLHDQVTVLSSPYMKSSSPTQQQMHQHQQNTERSKDETDLRSRGLCLVPISSTFPMAHESGVDFWTPTFGASFR